MTQKKKFPSKEELQKRARRAHGGFVRNLKKLRENRGSLQKFGESIGVAHTTVGQWEADDGGFPNGDVLWRIAHVHGVSLDWLLFGTGEERPLQPQTNADRSLEAAVGAYVLQALRARGQEARDLFVLTEDVEVGAALLNALVDLVEQEAEVLRRAYREWGAKARLHDTVLKIRAEAADTKSPELKRLAGLLSRDLGTLRNSRFPAVEGSLIARHLPQVKVALAIDNTPSPQPRDA